MFHTLRTLAPVEIGPWWNSRQYVYESLRELNVKPGDIICRCGNAAVYGYVPFSRFICHLTKSKYSHAALVLDTVGDILIADVNAAGLRRQYVTDWCDDIRGDDIIVLRYNGDSVAANLAVENARTLLISDIQNTEFVGNESSRNFYCVELVCWCYLRAGVMLCQDIPICKLPNWRSIYNLVAKMHGIDYNDAVWCVGNEEIGLLSSPHLMKIGEIPFKEFKQLAKRQHGFTGA